MEIWSFRHPEHGLIEVEHGFDAEFREVYPSWPGKSDNDNEGTHAGPDDSLKTRIEKWVHNPPLRLQIKVNGEVRRQLEQVPNGRVALQRLVKKGGLVSASSAGVHRDKPHLKVQSNTFGEILGIDYREGDTVVEFTPPPGTRGAKRHEAMESSAFKRVAYPLMAGLGKSGWALAALVLAPMVSRLIDWLLSFLPDFELPSLPPLPDVHLPVPTLPGINLPVPGISLPEVQVPDWVLFLAEYSKVWVPIVIALVIATLALRNHRKSEQKKREWSATSVPEVESDGVGQVGVDKR